MRVEEYLSAVTEQIRCTKARDLVSGELESHILEQAQAYEADGMFEEEALARAVKEMGDPVETGVALDRIHRPQTEWGLLLLAGVISLLGIGIHALLGMRNPDYAVTGIGYLKNYVMYAVFGYVLMLAVYRLDYSILGRYGRRAAAGFLILIIGLTCFSGVGVMVNGSLMYLNIGVFYLSVPVVMFLYVPLYGAVLYQYRGGGYGALLKMALWTAVPVCFVMRRPALSQAVTLGAALLGVLSVAVFKGWFAVNRRRTLFGIWGCALALPPVLLLFWWASGRMASYQAARLAAFFDGSYSENTYWQGLIHELVGNSSLIGGSEAAAETASALWGTVNSDYLLAYLIGSYGILAGVLAVGLLAFLIVRVFRVSSRQKNQLGMIVGCGCGMVYLSQTLLHLATNLLSFPLAQSTLPFFSSGGSGQVVSGMLLGLVLSVYRYKNILAEKPAKKRIQAVS